MRSIKSFVVRARAELSEKPQDAKSQIQALLVGDHGRERRGRGGVPPHVLPWLKPENCAASIVQGQAPFLGASGCES